MCRVRHQHDTDTYTCTELCDFLKLFAVPCPYPCFIASNFFFLESITKTNAQNILAWVRCRDKVAQNIGTVTWECKWGMMSPYGIAVWKLVVENAIHYQVMTSYTKRREKASFFSLFLHSLDFKHYSTHQWRVISLCWASEGPCWGPMQASTIYK
jgi:hypothetical protein